MITIGEKDREWLAKAGGSAASIFGGVGSFIGNNHRSASFALVGLGILLLLVSIIVQLTTEARFSKGIAAITVLALVIFAWFGYSDMFHPRVESTPVLPSKAAPINDGSAESHGDKAPAVVGNGNIVTYGKEDDAGKPSGKKHNK